MAKRNGRRRTKGVEAKPHSPRLLMMIAGGIALIGIITVVPGLPSGDEGLSPRPASGSQRPPLDRGTDSALAFDIEPASTSTVGAGKVGATASRPATTSGDIVTPLELGGVLVGVIALFLVCALLAARWMRHQRVMPHRDKLLKVRDALPLGAKRQVYLVECGERLLLLGCGSDDIELLADYHQDDVEPTAEAETADAAPQAAAPPHPTVSPRTASRRREKLEHRKARATSPKAETGESAPNPLAAKVAATYGSAGDLSEETDAPRKRGAERVPPAFRHLLEGALGEDGR